MSHSVPTIRVKQKEDKRVRVINLSEYDEDLHEMVESEKVEASVEKEKNDKREELKAILDKAGVEYNARFGEAKLQELVDAMLVIEEVGENEFVIVNGKGEQQGEEIFKSHEEAATMLELLESK